MNRYSLLIVILLTSMGSLKGQSIDLTHKFIAPLEASFHASVKKEVLENNGDWLKALLISDETVINALTGNFYTAERYSRTIYRDSSMNVLDRMLQEAILSHAIKTYPELAGGKAVDIAGLLTTVRHSRMDKKAKFSSAMVSLRLSDYFGKFLRTESIDGLIAFFNDYKYFLSQKEAIIQLSNTLRSKKEVDFRLNPIEGQQLIYKGTYLSKGKPIAQIKLAYTANDFFGKIQSIEFVKNNEIVWTEEDMEPPTVDELNK